MGKRVVTPKVVVTEPAPVVTQLMSVVQKKGTEFEATMSMAVSSAAVSNFNVVEKGSNRIVAVNTVAVDKTDATKVTFTTYESLTNGMVYTVTYTADNEAKTESSYEFTATDGTIDSLNLTPLTITAGKATTIKYQTLDKTGVILSEKTIGSPQTGIEVDTTYNDGYYTSNGDLYLGNVNDIATIKVSYHTYKYEGAEEIGLIEKTFTVKAVDSASVASYDYTIATDKPYNWATVKKNTQIAMGDENVYYAYIRIVDANGDALNAAQASEYSVTSSNDNVLLAAGTADDKILLTPTAQGTAYLVVSKDGKNVTSLPVTVGAKRVLTSVKLDKTSVTIATGSAGLASNIQDADKAEINVKYFDQYNVEIATNSGVTMTVSDPTSKPLSATNNDVTLTPSGESKIQVKATAAASGKYDYKVTGTDKDGNQKSAVFSVRVEKPGNATKIKLAVVQEGVNGTVKNIDTTLKAGSVAGQTIYVKPVGVGSNGLIVSGSPLSETVSISAITVKGNGTTYVATGRAVSKKVTSAAIDLQTEPTYDDGEITINVRDVSAGKNVAKYLPAGTYTISYTIYNKDTKLTTNVNESFTVKDEQPKTTVKIVEPNIGDEFTIEEALGNSKYAVFSYDGVAVTDADGTSTTGKMKLVLGSTVGTRATINSVVAAIPVKIGDDSYTINTVVPVNMSFSGKSTAFGNVKPASELKYYKNN